MILILIAIQLIQPSFLELLPFQDALVFFISQIQEDINGLIAVESPSTETEAALEKAFDF